MLEKVQLIFWKLPEMDQHILMGMYNPKAELSEEWQRLRVIIDKLPENERSSAVWWETKEAPEKEWGDDTPMINS
jgi:hypothetical protein